MPKQPTIARADLARVLTRASLFAGTDDCLPMLVSVKLEATGTDLVAIATDRFAMGVASAKYEGTPFEITLSMDEVKLIATACKLGFGRRAPKGDVDLRVTPKGTQLHVKLGETAITVPTSRYEFPRWRQLLPESAGDVVEIAGRLDVNPQLIAKLGKVGSSAKFYLRGGNKPITARVGDDFLAVIMPMRMDADDKPFALPEWLASPAPAAVKAVA